LAGALAHILGSERSTKAGGPVPISESPTPATCLANKNPATTAATLASIVSPALAARDCIGETSVELARGQG